MKKFMQFADHGSTRSICERTVLVLDVSCSMDDNDWPPSRLDGAKKASVALLDLKAEHHPDDQIGVVSFAASAEVVYEIGSVSDQLSSLKRALESLTTRSATNITAGLEAASALLNNGGQAPPPRGLLRLVSDFLYEDPAYSLNQPAAGADRLILLTDGEHITGPSPLATARRLKRTGVDIDVIGIGGSPADVNESMLKRIASKNPDGLPRYCFIGDKTELIREFKRLAQHIKRA